MVHDTVTEEKWCMQVHGSIEGREEGATEATRNKKHAEMAVGHRTGV